MSWATLTVIGKFIGTSVSGSVIATRAVIVATLSLARTLLSMVGGPCVDDLQKLKQSLLTKTNAEAVAASAEAQKKLAEAAEASRKANLHKRNDRLAKIEREYKAAEAAKVRADAAKTEAEADKVRADAEAVRLDAETKRLTAAAEAQAKLLDAIGKLKQEGGAFAIDPESLRRMLSATVVQPPAASVGQLAVGVAVVSELPPTPNA
jgi:hypothetical protein